ncbi:MAG: aminoacyl-tRNA hydrolase [Lachnospiraceae bacterium]|nr:aminoacyl-tRNA hydrolase [Lachnospiraceae bacterium]
MYIIAGLGNPTREYQNTRHNIGFEVIDRIADAYHISVLEKKHKALVGKGSIGGERVLLAKPQTFMNLSGESIRQMVEYYKADPGTQLLVIYDDIHLDVGRLRIRGRGSDGGHNGIKSILQHLGKDEFARIRVGVGEKPAGYDLADYVLGHFGKEERGLIDESIGEAVKAAELILLGRIEEAMNLYNRKKSKVSE